jgi:hypothetical protein
MGLHAAFASGDGRAGESASIFGGLDGRLESELATKASGLSREIAAQEVVAREIAAIRDRLAIRLEELRSTNQEIRDSRGGDESCDEAAGHRELQPSGPSAFRHSCRGGSRGADSYRGVPAGIHSRVDCARQRPFHLPLDADFVPMPAILIRTIGVGVNEGQKGPRRCVAK